MFRNRRNCSDTLDIEGHEAVSAFNLLLVILRSLAFNFIFFTSEILLFIVCSPLLFLPGKPFYFSKIATRYALWLAKVICGLDYKLEGQENIPEGGCVFASKHQSAWDTIVFLALYPDAVYVFKKELLAIPIYGHFAKKLGMISIDRADGRKAIIDLKNQAEEIAQQGRKIVIFPEGSRTSPGQTRPYQKGVYLLNKIIKDYPVIPVALNSGLFWKRRGMLKWPGVITIKFLKPMPQDLDADAFMSHLANRIDTASETLRYPNLKV